MYNFLSSFLDRGYTRQFIVIITVVSEFVWLSDFKSLNVRTTWTETTKTDVTVSLRQFVPRQQNSINNNNKHY